MAFIPSPINKLIGMAIALPKILKLVKRMATTSDGELGIFIAVGGVAAAPIIAKARAKANEVRDKGREKLDAKLDEIKAEAAESAGLTEEEQTEEMNDAIELVKNLESEISNLAAEIPMTKEEVEAIIEVEIEKIKPPLLAALTPFTAMIGIPVFLMKLMDYMEAADPYAAAGLAAAGEAPPLVPAGDSLTRDATNDPLPKYAEWGAPPEEDSPIEKKNSRGRKVKWWWTIPPQLPSDAPKGGPDGKEGDWTKRRHGGLRNKDAHKSLMKRRYDQ